MFAGAMEAVLAEIESGGFQRPAVDQKIFKEQCAFCFKDPHVTHGLYISLKNYHAFCREHVEFYAGKTGNNLYVQFESTKVIVEERSEERADGEPTNKMTKLTIDAEPKYEFEDHYAVVIHPKYEDKFTNIQGLEEITNAIRTISEATSAERIALMSSTSNAYDAEIKLITKHVNLAQNGDGKKLALSGWTCEVEDCGLTENLWLNLTDGAIRCGRSQYVASGDKTAGNGHMQDYYIATSYPLVVKLGTISSNFEMIDVYSYDEDDAVIDTNIEKHLKHFGLDPYKMEKTTKSTFEMELDMNEKWEWARCTEDGATLEPIYGPGYTGLINTGSSCYMNSALQALIQIDAFRKRYGEQALDIMFNCPIDKLHNDFNAQFAKVILAMLSGDYSLESDPAHNGIKPLQFKRVAAGTHVEFSTAKQQDVEEYIRHLFGKITKNSTTEDIDPTDAVRFQTWNRFKDLATDRVRYVEQEECILRLPLSDIQEQFKQIPNADNRMSVPMQDAITRCFGDQYIHGYKSPITGEEKGANTTLRMKTFPDYLLFQVQKFALSNDGVPKKLEVEMEVLDEIDLSAYRGHGKEEGEELLPVDEPEPAAAAPVREIPASVVAVAEQLMIMGFKDNQSMRAAFYSNGNADVATNWLMEHMEDPDINEPFVMPAETPAARGDADANLVAQIVDMGFSPHQAKYALAQSSDIAAAVEWLFANMDSIPEESVATGSSSADPEASVTETVNKKVFADGSEKYKLIGMISHMGSRPDSGHYVAHMIKDGKWVLFNDEKVALSQDPPKNLAYIYLYKRVD